jgi:hypothetical protein
MGGTVMVRKFPLEIFRRDAVLEHLTISLASPAPESELNGAVKVAYADYTITIQIIGTSGKPAIKMRSDPPLPEEQLVAVLLFGRPLEELDPDQNSSVGSTRAALADGAVGLASLYALASTPIQSVGYDPKRGVVNVKVRLGAGTSLNLGTTGATDQLETIGIRRRLGPHWTIETDLIRSTDETGRTASAFLEWSNRY